MKTNTHLQEDIFQRLARSAKKVEGKQRPSRQYRKRQVLFYEGTPNTGVHGIESGRVKVYKVTPEGKQHILRIADVGEVIGLDSVLSGDSYQSTAEMIEEGVVWFLAKETVLATICEDSEIALEVMKMLASEITTDGENRLNLAQNSVRERMARLLTILCEDYGVSEKGGIRIALPLSREEMAEMVGTAAETAMRFLKEFREDKLVEVHGRNIIVLNRGGLMKTAHIAS